MPPPEADILALNKAINARGYIVIACWGVDATRDYQPGDPVAVQLNRVPLGHPFYIICETDQQDFLDHQQAAGRPALAYEGPNPRRYWRASTD